jgi:hypothetical protein
MKRLKAPNVYDLGILASLAITACSPSDSEIKQLESQALSQLTLEEGVVPQLVQEGDPALGRVFIVKQEHKDDPKILDPRVISLHQRVYNSLVTLDDTIEIDGIYPEDLNEITLPLLNDPETGIITRVQELFPLREIKDSDLTDLAKGLYHYGAGITYAMRHDIPLHVAITKSEKPLQDEMIQKVNEERSKGNASCETLEYVINEREQMLINKVESELSLHPGQDLVIIYGAAHDLTDNFSQDFKGEIYLVDLLSQESRNISNQVKREHERRLANCI